MSKQNFPLAILLTSVGWGMGWSISWAVISILAYLGIQSGFASPMGFLLGLIVLIGVIAISGTSWAIGGLSTVLILWWKYPTFRWKQVLLATFGWIATGVIGFPTLFVVVFGIGSIVGIGASALLGSDNFLLNMLAMVLMFLLCLLSFLASWLLNGAVTGSVGSLIIGLILHRSNPLIGRKRTFLVIANWAVSLSIAWIIGWTASGLIWWTYLDGFRNVVARNISQVMERAIAVGIGGALGGMVGGIIGGGLGGLIMFWQLDRARV